MCPKTIATYPAPPHWPTKDLPTRMHPPSPYTRYYVPYKIYFRKPAHVRALGRVGAWLQLHLNNAC